MIDDGKREGERTHEENLYYRRAVLQAEITERRAWMLAQSSYELTSDTPAHALARVQSGAEHVTRGVAELERQLALVAGEIAP